MSIASLCLHAARRRDVWSRVFGNRASFVTSSTRLSTYVPNSSSHCCTYALYGVFYVFKGEYFQHASRCSSPGSSAGQQAQLFTSMFNTKIFLEEPSHADALFLRYIG